LLVDSIESMMMHGLTNPKLKKKRKKKIIVWCH